MRKRPRRLALLAIFLIAVSAGFPIQVMFLYGHPPTELAEIAAKLAPMNWAIMLFAPVAAWLVLRASRWVLLALPALVVMVAYNNWLVAQVGTNYAGWLTFVGTAIFTVMMVPFFDREAREALINPGRRWWLTPKRVRAELPVRMKVHVKENYKKRYENWSRDFYIKTYDVSEGGAFLPLEGPKGGQVKSQTHVRAADRKTPVSDLTIEQFPIGTQCFLCLPLKGLTYIQCRAEIVRVSPARGNYPAGVGVRFIGLSWQEKRLLTEFLEELPSVSTGGLVADHFGI